jgi:hypothetical protein
MTVRTIRARSLALVLCATFGVVTVQLSTVAPASAVTSVSDDENAIVEFTAAAARTTNLREQQYLTTKAARLPRTSTNPE